MFAALVLVAAVAAPPESKPPGRAEVAWAWSHTSGRPDCSAAVAWAWAQAKPEPKPAPPPTKPEPVGPPAPTQDELYSAARSEALHLRCPIVIGVGVDPPALDGTVSVRWDAYPGLRAPGVVVGTCNGTDCRVVAKFTGRATAADVRAALMPPATPVAGIGH
jgi:hypothetical protein